MRLDISIVFIEATSDIFERRSVAPSRKAKNEAIATIWKRAFAFFGNTGDFIGSLWKV